MTKSELLRYMRSHKLAVVGTTNASSLPEAAYVGVAVTDRFEVIFDTVSTTRKHRNLTVLPRIAVTYCGPGEKTLQYEGAAGLVLPTDPLGAEYREIYYEAWPECHDHLQWDGLVYWVVKPLWARYSDYDRGPLIHEFRWDQSGRPP